MKQKSLPLLTIVALVTVLVLAVNVVDARGREAAPGQIIQHDPAKNGGPDCANPTVITSPTTDSGNTCGAATNVSNYQNATCLTVNYPGPEVIYQIELFANNAITIDLRPDDTTDLGVFMVADCTTPTSCVDFHDAEGPGLDSRIPRVQAGAYTPGTYFLYIDSYYASGVASCGGYDLEVSGNVPVELIDFSVE